MEILVLKDYLQHLTIYNSNHIVNIVFIQLQQELISAVQNFFGAFKTTVSLKGTIQPAANAFTAPKHVSVI